MNTALFDLIEQGVPAPDRVRKLRVALSKPAFDMHGALALDTNQEMYGRILLGLKPNTTLI